MTKWTKFQTKAQKCSKVHFIREIGRFDEKLGDSRENWESWQLWGSSGTDRGQAEIIPIKRLRQLNRTG